jgi:3'(2'), 5'-bisphosphate nucleotidase
MIHLLRLARDAGRAIMSIYGSAFAVRDKSDLSPVTEADELAEKVILAGLANHVPDIPVIAEEQAAAGHIPETGNTFFLVDPLDGTKEFVSRNGEFTVNIAKIVDGVPVMGVVYAPALKVIYWGEQNVGAAFGSLSCEASTQGIPWLTAKTRDVPIEGLTVIASRSHRDAETDAFLATLNVDRLISAGSSLKFCRIAVGEADCYPRFGRTMEWDTAAGQAVLEAAGGRVCNLDGTPFRYGKRHRGFDNPGFIATGR